MNTVAETNVQFVAVGDDNLLCTVDDVGGVWVGIRRVSEALGLDSDTQRRKLKALPWARTEMISVHDTMGRAQPVAMIALKSLPMWLATIDHNRVGDDVAKKLVRFQMEAHDVLAAHFGASGSGGKMHGHHDRASGGASGSGHSPTTAMSTTGGSGSAGAMLAMVEGLTAAMRASLSEVAEVREMATANTRMLSEAQARVEVAEARARDAMAIADRAIANSTMAREDRRRCDAAVRVITKACQAWAGNTGESYRDIYSKLRRALGLRSTAHGGKSLGESKLSASQVLVLAHTATSLGVAGVGAARIRAILDGVDDPTRPGAIDAEVTSMSRVAARSADRTAP